MGHVALGMGLQHEVQELPQFQHKGAALEGDTSSQLLVSTALRGPVRISDVQTLQLSSALHGPVKISDVRPTSDVSRALRGLSPAMESPEPHGPRQAVEEPNP